MAPGIFKMITPILIITLIKSYVDTSSPEIITLFRWIFAIGQMIVVGSLIYVYYEIPKAQNSHQKIRVTKKDLTETSPFENLFNADDATKQEEEDKMKKIIKITVEEYDKIVWQRKFKQTMIAITIIPLLHWLFGIVVPLVMSVVLNGMGLLDDPLFRIYVRKHVDQKSLVRPFKFSNPMDNIKKMTDSWMPSVDTGSSNTNTNTTTNDTSNSTKQSNKKSRRRKKARKM